MAIKGAEELSRYIEMLSYRMKISEQTACDVVSLPEMLVVSFLGNQGSARMSEIAAHHRMSLSNLTAIVDKLVSKKIVLRVRSEEDRRVVQVSLTGGGHAVDRKNREQKLLLAEQMLDALQEEDRAKFMALMRKIVGKMQGEPLV